MPIRSRRRRGRGGAGVFAFQIPAEYTAIEAPLFWHSEIDDAVVTVDAIPAADGERDALDVMRLGGRAVLLIQPDAGEQLLLRIGGRSIRLDVRSGSLRHGPVRLRFAIEGFGGIDAKLLTIRRLIALWRHGVLPTDLSLPEHRASRWVMLLRTLDALDEGANQREIATALIGSEVVHRDWRKNSDYLRMRVQRLVRTARTLSESGYLNLLRSPGASVAPRRAGR